MSFFLLPSFILKKQKIDQALKELIDSYEENTPLKKAIEYAISNGGKRIRPIIVLMIQEALKCPYSLIDAAISIELFHTASLIADDLPLMDNDSERRNLPSTHVQFGDTVALLASYGLIALSFEKIHDCSRYIREFDEKHEKFSYKACSLALKAASYSAGFKGATLGQFYDLFPDATCEIEKLIYLKTITLFEVTFLFGWIFAGGSISEIDEVKKLSYHLGMAYQIADDINDLEDDLKKDKKVNYAISCGIESAFDKFQFHFEEMKKGIKDLGLNTQDFDCLISFLEKLVIKENKSLLI